MKFFNQLKLILLFLWEPEKVVKIPDDIHPDSAILSVSVLLFTVVIVSVLYFFDIAHLTCWTPKFYSRYKMPVLLFGVFAVIVAADTLLNHRKYILLYGSLAVSLVASPHLTVLAVSVLIPYWFIARLEIPPIFKHIWVILLHAGAMFAYSFKFFPDFVFDSHWGKAGIMWAFFLPLRLFWFHYQLTREKFKDFSLYETFLYFFLIPSPVIIPYMFALPRRNEIKEVLEPSDTVRARGILYVIAGLAFYVAYRFFDNTFTMLSSLPHMKFIMIPWIYPLEPVFWAIGSSYVLTGFYNRAGAGVTLAFRSPLNSPSVLEWWRRWNVHFRDMLVDIFFYPVVMGKRKHPYLKLWLGVFGVFIAGSTILHWIVKHYFMHAGFVPYYSMLIENSVMFFAVGILLHLERYELEKRKQLRREAKKRGEKLSPKPPKPLWYRLLSYPMTYFVVFLSVVGGYASNLIIFGTYIDRPSAVMSYAENLKKEGNLSEYKKYIKYAAQDFEKNISKYDDLTSPWRIRERHDAFKLALIYLNQRNTQKLQVLKSKLGWQNISDKNLKSKISYELSKYKGLNGLKLLFKGDL